MYWTNERYSLPNGESTYVSNFDGKNRMLYRLDENNNPVKECYASAYFRWDTTYNIRCIQINPVLDEEKDTNYCYHGKNDDYELFKAGITALEAGLPLLGSFCGPAVIPCMAGLGFISGLGGETLKSGLDIGRQWPAHS